MYTVHGHYFGSYRCSIPIAASTLDWADADSAKVDVEPTGSDQRFSSGKIRILCLHITYIRQKMRPWPFTYGHSYCMSVFFLLYVYVLFYVYVSSSCQPALFGYPDWDSSELFPQLQDKCHGKTRKDGARPTLNFCVGLCIVCFVSFCV